MGNRPSSECEKTLPHIHVLITGRTNYPNPTVPTVPILYANNAEGLNLIKKENNNFTVIPTIL